MNSSELEALFDETLLADSGCGAVCKLHLDKSREVFERAAAWCSSNNPLKRARAADILGQLGYEESYSILSKLLDSETEPGPLNSIIVALGQLAKPESVPLILGYRLHGDKSVRLAVAFALGCFPNDPQSVEGLLELTSDPDAEVRDWAVFGLGVQSDADSPEIRETLLRCLGAEDENVREEAAVGLGKRRDPRIIPKLIAMLDAEAPELKVRVADAAAAFLGLPEDPPGWKAADYKRALENVH
jgi:HEAT repeat protein